MNLEQAKKLLASPDETVVATLGNNYLQNFLTGQKVKQGYAILSDKRLYYHGKNITGKGRFMQMSTEDMAVLVDDVSATRFVSTRKIGQIILGVLFAALTIFILGCLYPTVTHYFRLLSDWHKYGYKFVVDFLINGIGPLVGTTICFASAVCFIKAFISPSTVFEIAFPGGAFRFDVKWYPMVDMQDFQRQIMLMKDHAKQV